MFKFECYAAKWFVDPKIDDSRIGSRPQAPYCCFARTDSSGLVNSGGDWSTL